MDTRVQTKPEFNLTRYHKNKLIFHCTLYLFINIYLPLPFSHCITNTFYLQKSHINTNLFKLLNIVIIALQFIRFIWSSYHWLEHLIKINIIVKFQPWIETQIPQNCIIRYRYQKNIHRLGNLTLRLCFTRTYFILKEKNGLFKLFVLS